MTENWRRHPLRWLRSWLAPKRHHCGKRAAPKGGEMADSDLLAALETTTEPTTPRSNTE